MDYSDILPKYLDRYSSAYHDQYRNLYSEGLENKTSNQENESGGLLGRIFSNKTKSLKATVNALLKEIELRKNLDSQLTQKIDDQICAQNTHILQLENLSSHYDIERFLEVNTKKKKIEKNILELEKEKRKEYLECWRDLMFLNKYLNSALKSYWDLAKKREVLEENFNHNENLSTNRRYLQKA